MTDVVLHTKTMYEVCKQLYVSSVILGQVTANATPDCMQITSHCCHVIPHTAFWKPVTEVDSIKLRVCKMHEQGHCVVCQPVVLCHD